MLQIGLESLAIYYKTRQREIMQGTPKEVHILEKSLETFKKSLETM